MSLALCMQVVSRAPQKFRPSTKNRADKTGGENIHQASQNGLRLRSIIYVFLDSAHQDSRPGLMFIIKADSMFFKRIIYITLAKYLGKESIADLFLSRSLCLAFSTQVLNKSHDLKRFLHDMADMFCIAPCLGNLSDISIQ